MCTFIHAHICMCTGVLHRVRLGGMCVGMCGRMRRIFDVVDASIGSEAGGHLAVGGRTVRGAAYTRTRHDSAWRFQGHEYLSAGSGGGGRL